MVLFIYIEDLYKSPFENHNWMIFCSWYINCQHVFLPTLLIWSIISNKAKGRMSKQVFQECQNGRFTRTCAYQGVRNFRFSDNLACFVFSENSFWDSPFALLRRNLSYIWSIWINCFLRLAFCLRKICQFWGSDKPCIQCKHGNI